MAGVNGTGGFSRTQRSMLLAQIEAWRKSPQGRRLLNGRRRASGSCTCCPTHGARRHRPYITEELKKLEHRFAALDAMTGRRGRQEAGTLLERLVYDLFLLLDLDPEHPYLVAGDQIDGAFTLNHARFIVEIKWQVQSVPRKEFDVFAAKIARRGMGCRGLFIAVNGFSPEAVEAHSRPASFICMDGADLARVLSGEIGLVDLLRLKLKDASDTGRCWRAGLALPEA